jgi:hypothetical protein
VPVVDALASTFSGWLHSFRAGRTAQANELRAFARTGGAGDNDVAANRLDMLYDAKFHDMIAELAGTG